MLSSGSVVFAAHIPADEVGAFRARVSAVRDVSQVDAHLDAD